MSLATKAAAVRRAAARAKALRQAVPEQAPAVSPAIATFAGYAPVNTQTAYKLFRARDGQIYPLFVNANEPVAMGEWLRAEAGPPAAGGKVKSRLGPLAYRPGWHAGDAPVATHIGGGGSPPAYRPDDQVWAEVLLAADRDWQSIANERGRNAAGRIVPVRAHITDQVPYEGFYRYKTNPNMTGNWLIGGDMSVQRILEDAEVSALNRAAGFEDLPRMRPLDLRALGF